MLLTVFVMFLAAAAPQAATVHGRVLLDDDGLPGVEVTLRCGTKQRTTFSNASGEFTLPDVPFGSGVLTAQLAGVRPLTTHVCMDRPEKRIEVRLDEVATSCDVLWGVPRSQLSIGGTVFDELGRPLPGASVEAILGDGSVAETQFTREDGTVTLHAAFGDDTVRTARIRISRRGYDMKVMEAPCYLRFKAALFPLCRG